MKIFLLVLVLASLSQFLCNVPDLNYSPDQLKKSKTGMKNWMLRKFKEKANKKAAMLDTKVIIPETDEDAAFDKITGDYVCIDCGGTTTRCSLVRFGGKGESVTDRRDNFKRVPEVVSTLSIDHDKTEYIIKDRDDELIETGMLSSIQENGVIESSKLFERIADAFKMFLDKTPTLQSEEKIKVAFTFSHPMEHLDIRKGKIKAFSKGIKDKDGLVRKDPVKLLEEKLNDLKVDIRCLVNDVTAAYVAARFRTGKDIALALIVGTGFNGGMDTSGINGVTERRCINGELGGLYLGKKKYRMFRRDLEIAAHKLIEKEERTGRQVQVLEKMVSGKYLPYLLKEWISSMKVKEEQQELRMEYEKLLEDETLFSTERMASILEAENIEGINEFVQENVIKMIKKIFERAQQLISCLCASVLDLKGIEPNKDSKEPIYIAADGSVILKVKDFIENVEKILEENFDYHVKIIKNDGGSMVGAAVIAAMSEPAQPHKPPATS